MIEDASVERVCFDGDSGGGSLADIADLPKITVCLKSAGYSVADFAKVWRGNVLRILHAAAENRLQFSESPTTAHNSSNR